jgi:phosphoglycerate dehydrogenase-like enzyme
MKILVDVPTHPATLARLRAVGRHRFDCEPEPAEAERPLDADRIRDVEVLFCTIPPANLADMTRLRWVQIASTGYSQLFRHGLAARGIHATNARGCFDVPIAEWNVAMMVNLARNLRQMIRNQEAAVWDRAAGFQREIRGATVGLWGYGGIGRETARLAKQLGMRVHVLARDRVRPAGNVYRVAGTGDPEGSLPDRVFRTGEELEFLGGLDFLVVAMPLTSRTEGLIGQRELEALPPRAFVLNPARGPIIAEEPLVRALASGRLAGAALDTHYRYPMPPDHPLWRMPNVVFTPHIAGSALSQEFLPRLWDIFAENLSRFDRGEPLLNELTANQLAGD